MRPTKSVAGISQRSEQIVGRIQRGMVEPEHRLVVMVVLDALRSAAAGDDEDRAWLVTDAEEWLSWIATQELSPAVMLELLSRRLGLPAVP